jgi:SAM-dependent methyltransferase
MTQNIYDDPEFFARYGQFDRSVEGLTGAPEWPAMRALLPDLRGRTVLDLGCGYGWFCRWAAGQGAAAVVGIDVSEKMLARARSEAADPPITYIRADLERLAVPDRPFDLVYSSLALHYVEDLVGLMAKVHAALAPGGSLVFSVEHPIFMAPTRPGWVTDPDGRKTWPVDAYLVEGPRRTDWLVAGVIKHHRTIGTILNLLIRQGFVIAHVEEWGPTDEQIAAKPCLAEERQRPAFLMVSARR